MRIIAVDDEKIAQWFIQSIQEENMLIYQEKIIGQEYGVDIINDLKAQEELCIQKYEFYENMAFDPELRDLFNDIKKKEKEQQN